LAYQPPTISIFLSEQTIHQPPANNNFLSQKITPTISHQSNKQTECAFAKLGIWVITNSKF
jgi:hypothetical protein